MKNREGEDKNLMPLEDFKSLMKLIPKSEKEKEFEKDPIKHMRDLDLGEQIEKKLERIIERYINNRKQQWRKRTM